MSPSILIDSSSSYITYGTAWTQGNDTQVVGGSYRSCRTDVNVFDILEPTEMRFSFTGASIEFFGQPSDNLQMNYTFDNTRSRQADLTFDKGVSGKTGISFYQVGGFDAGFHTISLIPTAGQPIFDYAIVTPTKTQGLYEDILIADDTDSMVHYNMDGKWSRESGTNFSGGRSYNNTQTGTDRPGDKFSVNFVGDSIGVYGMVNHQPGSVTSIYSIDGGPDTEYTYTYSSADAGSDWALHQKFYYKEVVPGNHTLTVTVTGITGSQKYWFDYITFEATSSTTLVEPSATPTSSSTKGFNWTGLITGIIVGGLALCFIWGCLKQRWQRRLAQLVAFSKAPPETVEVEVPRPPRMLRRPPHLQSTPPYEPPAPPSMPVPQHFPTSYSYPPAPEPNILHPPVNNYYSPGPSNNYSTATSPTSSPNPVDSGPLPNHASTLHPPTRTPSPLVPAPPAAQNSREPPEPDVNNMQREIERLREENDRIRAQTQNGRRNTAESDAGPADAPPPYNDANYID